MDTRVNTEVEEVELADLMFSEEQQDVDNEHEEEHDDNDLEGLSPEEMVVKLKERISKRNKALKKAKEANARILDERSELASRLDALEGKINSSPETKPADSSIEAEQEWMDRIADDPTQSVHYFGQKLQDLEGRMASYLQSFSESLEQRLSGVQRLASPDYHKYREDVDRVKKQFAELQLTEDQALAMAKKLRTTKRQLPRGDVGGHKVSRIPEKYDEKQLEEEVAKMGL